MPLESPSLLITDDDVDFRETLCAVLEPRGFHTLVAGDGQEALDVIDRQTVHLLLLDMHMPKLTGLETIKRVNQLAKPLPCILMSAKMDRQLADAARQARAFRVLSKPLGSRDVTDAVCQALKTVYGWQLPPVGR